MDAYGETKIPNIDFSKVFYDFRLDFQQKTDNLFNKTITVMQSCPFKATCKIFCKFPGSSSACQM